MRAPLLPAAGKALSSPPLHTAEGIRLYGENKNCLQCILCLFIIASYFLLFFLQGIASLIGCLLHPYRNYFLSSFSTGSHLSSLSVTVTRRDSLKVPSCPLPKASDMWPKVAPSLHPILNFEFYARRQRTSHLADTWFQYSSVMTAALWFPRLCKFPGPSLFPSLALQPFYRFNELVNIFPSIPTLLKFSIWGTCGLRPSNPHWHTAVVQPHTTRWPNYCSSQSGYLSPGPHFLSSLLYIHLW